MKKYVLSAILLFIFTIVLFLKYFGIFGVYGRFCIETIKMDGNELRDGLYLLDNNPRTSISLMLEDGVMHESVIEFRKRKVVNSLSFVLANGYDEKIVDELIEYSLDGVNYYQMRNNKKMTGKTMIYAFEKPYACKFIRITIKANERIEISNSEIKIDFGDEEDAIESRFEPESYSLSINEGIQNVTGKYAWTGQETIIYLKNDALSKKGLKIVYSIPVDEWQLENELLVDNKNSKIEIFVNGVLVETQTIGKDFPRELCEFNLNVDNTKNNIYEVKIIANSYFVPADVSDSTDTRKLSLRLFYVGD